jgi:Restriction endonuclease
MDDYDTYTLEQLFDACNGVGANTHQQGKTLEDLVEYVFSAAPSVEVFARDVKDDSGAQEVDLVFSHLHHVSLLPMPDVTIIVECKNEQQRTSAKQIRDFGAKLRSRNMNIGIFVTAAGLSGGPAKAAHSAIRDEQSTGVSIIVVTANELAALTDPDGLARLLKSRVNELRTFRTYRSI